MSIAAQSDRIVTGKIGARVLPKLIDATIRSNGKTEFLTQALELVVGETSAEFAALAHGVKGQWRTLAKWGGAKFAAHGVAGRDIRLGNLSVGRWLDRGSANLAQFYGPVIGREMQNVNRTG